jgi:hypothetical protein
MLGLFFLTGTALSAEPCSIEILDDENGWPVPLVELRTINNQRFISDNAGVIVIDAPDLLGVKTWFHLRGHGYSVAKDGFGYEGIRMTLQPGKRFTIKVKRKLPAKRLGRITGAGLFAESHKLGQMTDWKDQPVFGCDSVQNAIHENQLFWCWGDTLLSTYPLGRFHTIAATSSVQPLRTFKPPIQLRYNYFLDSNSLPRNVAQMPGEGPTWLDGLVSLKDKDGHEHLVASYSKIKKPMTVYETGLCVWNTEKESFEHYRTIWNETDSSTKHSPDRPFGHACFWVDRQRQHWVLFGDPFPHIRCKATFEAWSNPEHWETLSGTVTIHAANNGKKIIPHRGAVSWNPYRNRWVTIFTQQGGESSLIGELWYAEAESPLGPWENAVHVVTHDHYSFYNPQIHSSFIDEKSPFLLFEATYTRAFSKSHESTPRYDYNQILYRLDFDTLGFD